MSVEHDDYLTRDELAKLLRVTTRTIFNYEESGAVPAPVKVGRKHLWSRSALVEFFKKAQSDVEAAEKAPVQSQVDKTRAPRDDNKGVS